MLRPLLDSARVSNLPTIWTNVLVGCSLARSGDSIAHDLSRSLAMLASASLFYVGGMWLNDAVDAGWDRAHGKDRPIPAGRISRRAVSAAAILALALGFIAAIGVHPSAREVWLVSGILLAAIVLYNLLHKRSAWCVLLMGACRALVYPLAASISLAGFAVSPSFPQGLTGPYELTWPASVALFAYIALLTLAARREDIAGARVGGLWAWIMPIPIFLAAFVLRPDHFFGTFVVTVGFLWWTIECSFRAHDGKIPRAVSGWLAGICLADATLLMFMDRLDLAAIAVACWLLTLVGQRTISGT